MMTLGNILTEWSDYLKSLNYSSRSIECYHEECVLFIRWLNRTYSIITPDQLRKDHLLSWQKHLSGRRNSKGAPLSPKTINRKISSIRSLLGYLTTRGFILKTLTEVLCLVKEPQLLPHGVLNHSKMKKALSKMPTGTPAQYRNRTMLEMLYSTALRARELLSLDITSVDIKNSTATVIGKGSKERVVPIGKTAMRYLETYIKAVRPFLEKDGYSKALFLSVQGERLAYASFLEIVHKHCDGVSDFSITPHTFRRSCTTEMIKGGANLYHVKELLGHESIDTLRPYIKLTIKDLKKTHAKCHPRERDS